MIRKRSKTCLKFNVLFEQDIFVYACIRNERVYPSDDTRILFVFDLRDTDVMYLQRLNGYPGSDMSRRDRGSHANCANF